MITGVLLAFLVLKNTVFRWSKIKVGTKVGTNGHQLGHDSLRQNEIPSTTRFFKESYNTIENVIFYEEVEAFSRTFSLLLLHHLAQYVFRLQ